jgi:hypothetical protein
VRPRPLSRRALTDATVRTQLLIGGISEIDVDDWRRNTVYRNYNEHDQVIVWFWKVRTTCMGRVLAGMSA